MADEAASLVKQRRRRRRRRKLFVGALVLVLLVAGAGTAWALQGPEGPQYRLASVKRTDVRQTVDSDGTLAARKTATAAFASGGTVNSVRVAVGDKVSAGQILATIDGTSLEAAVTSAKTTLAQAKQKLADDEEAQENGTSSTSSSTTDTSNWSTGSTTTDATTTSATRTATTQASDAVLVAAVKSTKPRPATSSSSSLAKAQAAVASAQGKLDGAISAQDDNVTKLITSCAASNSGSPTTTKVTGGSDGEVSGNAGASPAIVTLLDSDGDAVQTLRLTNGGVYSFTGLTAGKIYQVQITLSAVVNTDDCTAAVQDVQAGQKGVHGVDAASKALDTALAALTAAIKAQGTQRTGETTGSTGGSTTSGGSTTTRTGSGTTQGSGSAEKNGSSTGSSSTRSSGAGSSTTVTAEQIAADTKAIDAAKADVAVAKQNLTTAVLRSPIAGTIGSVAIAKGDSVSASSSASTITVVGDGTLSIALDISLADIALVKAGQTAQVTVDGHSAALPAKVSYVGVLNSSSSTGSSSAYSVTVQLDRTYASLYDGMGATVAIDVGSARSVLAVPISAVHTTGTIDTVDLYAKGKSTIKRVTLGVVGDDVVQIKSGLAVSDQVVLANIGASIPSSNTTNRRGNNSSRLSGLTSGSGGSGGGPGGR